MSKPLAAFFGAVGDSNKRKSVESATTSTVEKVSSLPKSYKWKSDLKTDVGGVSTLKTDTEKLGKNEGDLTGLVPIKKTDDAGYSVTEPYKQKSERTSQVSTNLKRAILKYMNDLDKELTSVKPSMLRQVCRWSSPIIFYESIVIRLGLNLGYDDILVSYIYGV